LFLFILINSLIPFDSPLNIGIDYLQVRGLNRVTVIKPFAIEEMIYDIDTLFFMEEKLNRIDKIIISSFGPFFTKSNEFNTIFNINAGRKETEELYSNLDLQLAGRLNDNISFAQGLRFHFSSKIDYTGPKPWEDIVQAYLNEGYIKFKSKKSEFTVGRRNLLLGFGDEHSLLLSPAKEGYDGFIFTYEDKYFIFNSTFSVLDPEKMRCISTHRLGLNLRNIQLGFSESILWAGEIEPLYLNFLLPYYLSQWGIDRNDNIMWCFDGLIHFSNTVLSGEFLIDDYQFSEPPLGYTEYPHKLGFQCGIKKIIFEKLFFKFNYTFIDKWVYTHQIPENTYVDDSLCLGFPLGNDVDQLTCNLRFLNKTKLFPKIRFEFTRKGEGSLYLPYEVERGPAYPEFPSGFVEKRISILPGIEFYFSPRIYLSLEAGKKYIYNAEHIPDLDKDENMFNLFLWFLL